MKTFQIIHLFPAGPEKPNVESIKNYLKLSKALHLNK